MTYLLLFWEFVQIGLFAIGGGMATIPFLFDLSARRPDWFSRQMLSDMIAVSESTPGPIGINMATYVGNTVGGIMGGVVATLSLALPSFIIILVIAKILEKFKKSPLVETLFRFIRPVAIGMMFYALYVSLEVALFSADGSGFQLKNAIVFAVFTCLIMVFKKKVHPLVWILIGAVVGILIF